MWIQLAAWLACVVYSTVPAFWFMIHPFAERWRARHRSPYRVLLPAWIAMWAIMALLTRPWRQISFYSAGWTWVPALLLFAGGFYLYARSGKSFNAQQLGGLPEVHGGNRDQRLVTGGDSRLRAASRVPGPSLRNACLEHRNRPGGVLGADRLRNGTGAVMIRMEDAELEKRFGDEYRAYRGRCRGCLPRVLSPRQL